MTTSVPGSGKLLVTGSAGFIGSHLVRHLSVSGRDVVGVDRREPGPGGEQPNLRHIVGDLRDLALEPLLEGVSTVVHLAAIPGVRASWQEFDTYLECNLLVTRRLLEACQTAGVRRFVIASSSSVYGDGADEPMSETRIPAPASPYAVTKLAAEQLALAYMQRPASRMSAVALRFFTVYGPGQRPDMLISRLITAALTRGPIDIYGDGSARRDFIYVGDVVRAVAAAVDSPISGAVLNIGTGQSISVADLIDQVIGLTEGAPVVVHRERKAGDVRFTLADVRQAAQFLGFRASTSLAEGLRRSIDDRRSLMSMVEG